MVERLKALWLNGTRRFQALRLRPAVVLVAVVASVYTLWFAVDVLASLPDRNEIRAFRVMAQASVLFDADDRPVCPRFLVETGYRKRVPRRLEARRVR